MVLIGLRLDLVYRQANGCKREEQKLNLTEALKQARTVTCSPGDAEHPDFKVKKFRKLERFTIYIIEMRHFFRQ